MRQFGKNCIQGRGRGMCAGTGTGHMHTSDPYRQKSTPGTPPGFSPEYGKNPPPASLLRRSSTPPGAGPAPFFSRKTSRSSSRISPRERPASYRIIRFIPSSSGASGRLIRPGSGVQYRKYPSWRAGTGGRGLHTEWHSADEITLPFPQADLENTASIAARRAPIPAWRRGDHGCGGDPG